MTEESERDALRCFVSYAPGGQAWAEWIGWTLEEAGYRAVVEAWDLTPGMHSVAWLDKQVRETHCMIAVASEDYGGWKAIEEWGAIWLSREAVDRPKLLVARVTETQPKGLLGARTPIDLFDRGPLDAVATLLASVRGDRVRPERAPEMPGRPLVAPDRPAVWNVPEAPARFVGRSDALGQLDAALAGVPLVSVTGIAGIGKTSLVSEHVHRNRAELDAVWWVPGHNPGLIGGRIQELASALGLPARTEPAAVLDRLDRSGSRWIVVVDDVPDGAELPTWLRSTGAGRLVLTSRSPGWEHLGPVLDVGPMDRADSVTLLADRLPTIDRETAGRIAERLSDHPLALDQATNAMSRGKIPAEAYLHALSEQPRAMLAEGQVSERPGVTAATLWDEPIRQVDASEPAAGQFLRFVAHGADEPFPIRLLSAAADAVPGAELRTSAASVTDLGRNVSSLQGAGLAYRPGPWHVAMHPLVRSAVHAQTSPEQSEQIVAAMTRMLRASLPETPVDEPASWPRWRELLPHALTVLEATDPRRDGPDAARLAEASATFLLEQGLAEPALDLASRAAEAHERLDGPDHAETLNARETLTRAALAADRIDLAGPLAERNATDRERLLGPDHPDTLTSRHTLAQVLQKDGQLRDAVDLFEQALADRGRVLGPNHPDTLTSQHHLGGAYVAAGDGEKAAQLLDASLTARCRVLGENHPASLETSHQLGVTYRRNGSVNDALPHLEQVRTDRIQVLGPDHPDTLRTHQDLGLTYGKAGRLDDATREFGRALAGRELVLGERHPATLDSAHGLAGIHRRAGRFEQAVPLLEHALEGRRLAQGRDQPESAQITETREILAETYRKLGRLDDAAPHLRAVLDRHENVLGRDHPRTVEARDALATTYQSAGRLDAAMPLRERLLGDRARERGAGDPSVLRAADELTTIYRITGRFDRALDLTGRVLDTRRELLGPHHPDTRATRNALADTYLEAGRPAKAVPLRRDALTDAVREHGPDHPETIQARRTLTDTLGLARRDDPRPTERLPPIEPRFSDGRP